MSTTYLYYDLEGSPCRVIRRSDDSDKAELYKAGTGFVPTSVMEIEWEGVPISKQAFDKMILKIVSMTSDV